jgi:hypothetical protein
LDTPPQEWSFSKLESFLGRADDGTLARMARLMVHMLSSSSDGRGISLELVKTVMERIKGIDSTRIKDYIFGLKVVKGLFAKDEGDDYRDGRSDEMLVPYADWLCSA